MNEHESHEAVAGRAVEEARAAVAVTSQAVSDAVAATLTPELVRALVERAFWDQPDVAAGMFPASLANFLRGLRARLGEQAAAFGAWWSEHQPEPRWTLPSTEQEVRSVVETGIRATIADPWLSAFSLQGFSTRPAFLEKLPAVRDFLPRAAVIQAHAQALDALQDALNAVDAARLKDRDEFLGRLWVAALNEAGPDFGEAVRTAPPPESAE